MSEVFVGLLTKPAAAMCSRRREMRAERRRPGRRAHAHQQRHRRHDPPPPLCDSPALLELMREMDIPTALIASARRWRVPHHRRRRLPRRLRDDAPPDRAGAPAHRLHQWQSRPVGQRAALDRLPRRHRRRRAAAGQRPRGHWPLQLPLRLDATERLLALDPAPPPSLRPTTTWPLRLSPWRTVRAWMCRRPDRRRL